MRLPQMIRNFCIVAQCQCHHCHPPPAELQALQGKAVQCHSQLSITGFKLIISFKLMISSPVISPDFSLELTGFSWGST